MALETLTNFTKLGNAAMREYIVKQAVVEAILFTGNDAECMSFCPGTTDPDENRPSLILRDGQRVEVGDYIYRTKGEEDYFVLGKEEFEDLYVPHEDPVMGKDVTELLHAAMALLLDVQTGAESGALHKISIESRLFNAISDMAKRRGEGIADVTRRVMDQYPVKTVAGAR